MKILILNGPNLNLLGMREPQHYGTTTYAALIEGLVRYCAARGADAECFQSNHEGDLVDAIQQAYGKADGIVFNPGAYTHTSIALLDAGYSDGGGAYLRCEQPRAVPPPKLYPPRLYCHDRGARHKGI